MSPLSVPGGETGTEMGITFRKTISPHDFNVINFDFDAINGCAQSISLREVCEVLSW